LVDFDLAIDPSGMGLMVRPASMLVTSASAAVPAACRRGPHFISFMERSHLMNRACASSPATSNARRMRAALVSASVVRCRYRRFRSVSDIALP
jgi:hypothetical protein